MNETFTVPPLDTSRRGQRNHTISNRVFDALRLAIVQLQLKPGNPLSEAEVAKQMGVSRQPVREAFIKLSEIGLVEIRPQRGTFVMMISRREVDNARFLREAIEVAIVRKACEEIGPQSITELRDIVLRQEQASKGDDHALFFRLDEAFHRALAHSVDCDYAWRVVESLKAQMDRVRYLSIPQATPMDKLIGEHMAIVDAIEVRDPDRGESEMRRHLSEIISSLPKIAAANPDLFVD